MVEMNESGNFGDWLVGLFLLFLLVSAGIYLLVSNALGNIIPIS